nr:MULTISPECIES: DUF397 domain-containing protein [unclassified Actinopolyspora]
MSPSGPTGRPSGFVPGGRPVFRQGRNALPVGAGLRIGIIRSVSEETQPVDDKAHIRDQLDFSNAEWITSTDDDDEPGVEIAFVDGYIGMRNGADPEGPVLVFTPEEWDAFVAGAKDGEFDEP